MKGNLARKIEDEDTPVHQTTGVVVHADAAEIVVRTGAGRVPARRARSCLVVPRAGDEVLLCLVGDAAYVLAVLDGDPEAATTLGVEGDLTIKLGSGRLSIAAQEGVSVVSGSFVADASPEVSVHAVAADVVLERLSWLAGAVDAEVQRVRLVAGTIERVADRIMERVKRSYRKVLEVDHLDAEQLDWEARKNLSLHCDNALVTANKLVKIDGDQIHLG
jgi:hypothetical protein